MTLKKGKAMELPKRKALGKGLESLLPKITANAAPAEPKATSVEGTPREIPLAEIDRNPYQTRTRFDEAQLNELAASIRATGVVQPILVRPLASGRFQLIAGERREDDHPCNRQAGLRRAGDGDHHRRKPAAH
jgi:ParB family transcriptional regulator, chromosome partitioning protein